MVMVGAAGLDVVIVKAFDPVAPMLSVTKTVKLDVPAAVGVPEIIPLLDERLSPVGKLPVEIENV